MPRSQIWLRSHVVDNTGVQYYAIAATTSDAAPASGAAHENAAAAGRADEKRKRSGVLFPDTPLDANLLFPDQSSSMPPVSGSMASRPAITLITVSPNADSSGPNQSSTAAHVPSAPTTISTYVPTSSKLTQLEQRPLSGSSFAKMGAMQENEPLLSAEGESGAPATATSTSPPPQGSQRPVSQPTTQLAPPSPPATSPPSSRPPSTIAAPGASGGASSGQILRSESFGIPLIDDSPKRNKNNA